MDVVDTAVPSLETDGGTINTDGADLSLLARLPEPELPADRFLDRELSWLAFNDRVLDLARDTVRVPLLERAKFLAIFASNLDEFFMVRVAGLKRRIAAGVAVPGRERAAAARPARRDPQPDPRARRGAAPPVLRRDPSGPGRDGHRAPALGRAASRGARAHARALRRPHLPRADAAGRRPVAPLPVHLGAVDQPRGPGQEPRDRRAAVRAGQGADRAAAVHVARRGPLRPARGRHRAAPGPAVQRHAGRQPPRLPGHPERGRRGGGGRRREPAGRPRARAAAPQGRPPARAPRGRGRHGPADAGDPRPPSSTSPSARCSRCPARWTCAGCSR